MTSARWKGLAFIPVRSVWVRLGLALAANPLNTHGADLGHH